MTPDRPPHRLARSADRAEHPQEAARLLAESEADEPLLVAGLLHDLLEKTATTEDELRATFGHRVTSPVASVTADDTNDDRSARPTDLRRQVAATGPGSGLLFAADRMSKLPELEAAGRRRSSRPRAGEPRPPGGDTPAFDLGGILGVIIGAMILLPIAGFVLKRTDTVQQLEK